MFQVTDPPGKMLLSQDQAKCREFTVLGGIITGVVAAGGCEHKTGLDIDHGATTVQLMPYLDTPNNGGVYKVWATLESNYLAGCALLGKSNGLNEIDCGYTPGVAVHGFIPGNSKTDNFKVKQPIPQEIDTQFLDGNGDPIDGLHITWTDPVGASNGKWSYYAPKLLVNHEAHVEAVTSGTHYIPVDNQAGCTIVKVVYRNKTVATGPTTVAVKVSNTNQTFGDLIKVYCA